MRCPRPEPGRNRRLGRYSAFVQNLSLRSSLRASGPHPEGRGKYHAPPGGSMRTSPRIGWAALATQLGWRGFFQGKRVAQPGNQFAVVGQRLFEGDLVPNVQSLGIIPGVAHFDAVGADFAVAEAERIMGQL